MQHFACGAVVAAGPSPVRPVSELFEDGPQGAGGGIGCVQPGENENRVFVAARKCSEQRLLRWPVRRPRRRCSLRRLASLDEKFDDRGNGGLGGASADKQPDVPGIEAQLVFVRGTDKVDQRCGGGFRHDVITGGQDGQERHRDRGKGDAVATEEAACR